MGNIFGDFIDAVTGNDHTTEVHEDGSYTDRYPDRDTSLTYDSNGNLLENSYSEPQFPGSSVNWQITKDGDGNVINVQNRND